IYAQQNKFDLAIQNLRKVIDIRMEKMDKYGVAIATINLSESFYNAKQLDSAIKYALEAEHFGRVVNFPDLIKHTYKQLSEMYKSKGDFQKALQFHERFASLNDSIFNENKSKQMTEMSVKFETERKEQQIKVLNKQRVIQRLGLIASVLGLLIMMVVAYTIYKSRKQKEEKLRTESAFQLQLKEAEARNAMQQERLRISRELHDNIGSYLTFIKASVEQADEGSTPSVPLQDIRQLTDETIAELRKTVWLMNNPEVQLSAFNSKLIDYYKKIAQVKVLPVAGNPELVLGNQIATHLFRIIQEGVTNALKHASSSLVIVHLEAENGLLKASISDSGTGMDTSNENMGSGLRNLRDRVKELNGTLEIQSEKGNGTRLTIQFPMIRSFA
nr:sensor histidine kinase [Flavihumibacter sp.]